MKIKLYWWHNLYWWHSVEDVLTACVKVTPITNILLHTCTSQVMRCHTRAIWVLPWPDQHVAVYCVITSCSQSYWSLIISLIIFYSYFDHLLWTELHSQYNCVCRNVTHFSQDYFCRHNNHTHVNTICHKLCLQFGFC